MTNPPPNVIHIKNGNIKFNKLYELLTKRWDDIIMIINKVKWLIITKVNCIVQIRQRESFIKKWGLVV